MARVTSVLFRATLRALNRIGEGVERVGIRSVSLDERELRAVACRETGLSDFGDEDFREPLSQLLRALETEARLTLVGRIVARADIVGLLANRLRLEEDRRRHPEIGEERIRRPVFIVGLPRSGSTLLHHLLAQDPASRAARAWEVMEPSPPPEKACYETDPRIARAARRLRWFDRLVPDFKRIHPLGAELPLECIVIMSASFVSPRFHNYHVPSYQKWLAAADLRPAYEFHRRFLQHLQWRAPAGHWVLKAPSHVFGFEPLFATYPDAVVVQTHRDPVTVLASVASKTLVLRGAFTDRLDPVEIGAEETQRWSNGLELAMQARQDGRWESRFLDVRYQDLLRDPMATVRRIYDRFGMALTVAAEAWMQRFLATHPKDRHGPHRYSLETFGLDARDLAHRFKSYRERFGLEPEVERSHNIHWQATDVRKQARSAQKGQKACVVWFTGLSGSGKSTIANLVEKKLHVCGLHTYLLDGDNVRHGLNRDLGFTDEDRVENIRRVAEVAKLMVDAGLIVLVSFISPFRSGRRMARALVEADEFIEVFVDVPLAVAEERDPKGLYRKARRGELLNFTGVDSPYEAPEHAEIRIDTTVHTPENAADQIIALLQGRGAIGSP